MDDAILLRNFSLMKHIFDNLDVLTVHYKLKQRDINVISTLLSKHTTYNAYIEVKASDFTEPRRTLYRALDKLENKNIITVVERPNNQYGFIKIYFTLLFIRQVCTEEIADLYEKWFEWQISFKDDKKGD